MHYNVDNHMQKKGPFRGSRHHYHRYHNPDAKQHMQFILCIEVHSVCLTPPLDVAQLAATLECQQLLTM